MLATYLNYTKVFTRAAIVISLTLSFCLPFFVKNEGLAATGINRQINFQGKLVNNPNGTNVNNTNHTVVFTIYDRDSGGTALWTETQSVTTADGIFRVALGSVTPIPPNFNFNWSGLYLGMKVNTDSEMTPRIQLAAVPFAFNAEKVSGLTVQDDAGNASSSGTLRIGTAGSSKTVTFAGLNGLTFNDTTSGGTTISFPAVASMTIVGEATTQVLTNKTIGSTGLVFSGAATDITTATNEDLVISPNGSGKVGINVPIGSTLLASIDLRGNPVAGGTLSIASVSGRTSYATLVANNDGVGDLFTASASSWTRFVIKNDGSVGIGVNNPNNLFQVAGLINFDNSRDLTALGYQAGLNTTGGDNSFIGYQAGQNTSVGIDNTFLGSLAGRANTTGSDNAFLGYAAGADSSTGYNNSFFGSQAGISNTFGTNNTFLGNLAGQNNTIGGLNTILGAGANLQSQNLINATAIGANAFVAQHNSLVLGSVAGINLATESAKIGIGTINPNAILDVKGGFGANALLTLNQLNNGNLITASLAGTTKFIVTSAGSISIGGGQAADIDTLTQTTLKIGTTYASALTLGNSTSSSIDFSVGSSGNFIFKKNALAYECTDTDKLTLNSLGQLICATDQTGGGTGVNWWNQVGGALSPVDTTNDLLFGGSATSSATFHVYGSKFKGTNPVASISANTSYAAFVIDQIGKGGIFTASVSGKTMFTLGNTGNMYTAGSISSTELILGTSSASLISAVKGFNGYTNFSGGIGTGGADSILNSQRLTSQGNLINIGSYQGGEMLLKKGGIFSLRQDYTAAGGTYDIAIGDLNGDGKDDIATANTAGNVSIFINNGDGTFPITGSTYTSGSSPRGIVIGDLNGDGKADLATANNGSTSVSIFINRGDGTFNPKVDYTTGNQPTSIDMGDFNGDGKADIVTANNGAQSVSILINKGDGTFNPKGDYTTNETFPKSVVTGDVSGDGKIDIAVSSGSTSLTVYINNGDGTFPTTGVTYAATATPADIVMGDINKDGKADLVVVNNGTSSISVFINLGNGIFAAKQDYLASSAAFGIGMGDVDGDGYPDLAVAPQAGWTSVFINNRNGGFNLKVDYTTGSGARAVAIGDLNGDGKADLATANNTAGTVSVLINQSNPIFYASASSGRLGIGTINPEAVLDIRGNTATFAGTLAVASVSGLTSFAALVVNNDGLGDLFTASASGWTRFSVKNDGTIYSSIYTTAGQCLQAQASGVFALGTCGGGGVNWWNQVGGLVTPTSSLYDFAVGGSATVSALFSFTGIQDLQHQTQASISGQLLVYSNNGYGGNASLSAHLVLGASGNPIIQTTSNQLLILGGNTTGNIKFSPNNTDTLVLSPNIATFVGTNPIITATGTNTLTFNNNSTGDIQFFSSSNTLSSAGAFSLNAGTGSNITLAGTTGITMSGNGAGIAFSGTGISQITTAANQNLAINPGGNGLVGVNTDGQAVLASLDARGNHGTIAVASVSGKTSYAGLVANNDGVGDIFTASASGWTRFKIENTGKVTIGNNTNGLTFDPTTAVTQIYNGSTRPTKTITLSPEYPGAVLTTFYGAGTDTSVTGNMTSDTDTTPGTSIRNYYDWTRTATTQNFYTVAVRISLPADFSAWTTTGAVVVNYRTGNATSTNSLVDVRIYNENSGTIVASSVNNANIAWSQVSLGASSLTGWATSGQTAVIYLRMGSQSSNYARVGDIQLNYLSKF